VVDVLLPSYSTAVFTGGADRYRDIVPDDMMDRAWVLGDECPGRGVHALYDVADVSLVCVPDLYSPGPLAPIESIVDGGGAGADFSECVEPLIPEQAAPIEDLDGLRLDPNTDLDAIIFWQQQLVSFAASQQSFIVLLDVPPRLSQRRILYWRAAFDSAYAATYHPWLTVSRSDDERDALIQVNPSAVAAGVIARREIDFGVPDGPANVIAAGVVDVLDHVSPRRHDELHQNAVNVYLQERDGVRLSAARTLSSSDQSYRQLSVRRLVTMLRRVLYRQMQWTVFEPNNGVLRDTIVTALENFLRQLYERNAFSGATEREAFFVRCDASINPQSVLDQGQLIVLVGVAPAEPLEFIVLQLAREGDGTLRVTPT
jgi:phage tail sheath protein FI